MTDVAPEAGEAEGAPEPEADLDALLGGQPETAAEEHEEGGEATASEDDDEEIDYQGRKVRIPKGMQAERLMHADYTRKTQEVAEQRKALETEKASVLTAATDHIKAVAKVQAMDEQLEAYGKVDWDTLNAQDPNLAATHWRKRTQLVEARQAAVTELQTKERERETERQRLAATAIGDAQAVLARDIKGWSPELAGKLSDFAAKEFGATPQELGQITDPRIVKLLHRAYEGSKAQKTQAAAQQAQRQEAVRPTPPVGRGAAPSATLRGDLSDGEFFKRAEAVLAKKA